MTDVLIRETFRHKGGALATATSIDVTARGGDAPLQTLVTNDLGSVSFYIAEGQYDFRVFGARIPFDAISFRTRRILSLSSVPTLTLDLASHDAAEVASQGEPLLIESPIGAPAGLQSVIFLVTDDGTAQPITWAPDYRWVEVVKPESTIPGTTLHVGVIRNAAMATWDVTALAQQ